MRNGCNGGGIGNYGTMTVTGSDISNNNAYSGGGIYNMGYDVKIDNSNIDYNTATESGAGIENFREFDFN